MRASIVDNDMIPLVELTRGDLVESSHWGALAVVDSEGEILAAAGNPGLMAYMRSSAKPFQVLPTVAAGAIDRFGLDETALALMCASHYGTEAHVAIAQNILDRIGLDKSALRCGVHWPIDEEAAHQLAAAYREPDPRHNNCSGKHIGMLTLARHWGCWQPEQDYTQPGHPVQQSILQRLSELAGLPASAIRQAPDGCTAPTFALPLANVALAYARLVAPNAPADCRRVVAAMQAHPHIISNHGALDDTLMRAGQGRIVCKGGAEGYEGLGVRTPGGRAVGVALKIADGNGRGKGVALVAVLKALGLVDEATLARLEPLRRPPRTNRRDQIVGEMRPAFALAHFHPPWPLEAQQ